MRTVKEVCRLTGVSARTLHYYDEIGLLKPSAVTDAGYRLYDDDRIERLGQILLFRELGFPLREISEILNRPGFDRTRALDQQIGLLTLQKQRLEAIISFAEKVRRTGVYQMDFKVFDKEKIERYEAEARKAWGETDAYREYRKKSADYSDEKQKTLSEELMRIFAEFGTMREKPVGDSAVQGQVQKLRDFISANYYTCTRQILAGLGQMYRAGGEMTDNIDAAGGEGTAVFASDAIAEYCK